MTKILVALLFWFIGFQAQAVGVTVRGGGDEVGLDFQSALNVAVSVAEKDEELNRSIDWDKLQNLIVEIAVVDRDLIVEMRPGVFQNSIATNDPLTKVIQINRSRWNTLSEVIIKQGIALHEVLSLIGMEKSGLYSLSSKYVEKFGISNAKFIASIGWKISEPILDKYELSSVSVVCTGSCNTGSFYPNEYQVSPDGARIIESKFFRRGFSHWRLFDLVGRNLVEFDGYDFRIWNMFLKDGSFLGSFRGLVSIYDRSGKVTQTLAGTDISSIRWDKLSPDKERLVLSFGKYWQLWDVSSKNAVLLSTSNRKLDSVTFDSNTKNFISSEDDSTLVTLRNNFGSTVKTLGQVSVKGFAPKGGASYYQDLATNRLIVLDVDGNELTSPNWTFGFLAQILFPFNTDKWIAVDSKGLLSIWTERNQLLKTFSQLDISRAELSPDGNLLVSEKGMNYDLELVNLKTARAFPLKLDSNGTLRVQQFAVKKFAFNDFVVSAHNFLNGTSALYGWNTHGQMVTRFYEGPERVEVLRADSIKRRVLVKVGNNKLFVWNVDLAEPIFTFDILMSELISVDFTARGLMLVTSDGGIKVQIERWEPLQ